MPLIVIPWYAWVAGIGGATVVAGIGTYELTSKAAEAIKKNAIPLSLIAAGTFLTLRMMQKAGKAA